MWWGLINKAKVKVHMPTLRQALKEIDLPEEFTLAQIKTPLREKYIELRQGDIHGLQLKREIAKLDRGHTSVVPRVLNTMRIYSYGATSGNKIFKR